MTDFDWRVRTALADAWAAEGRVRDGAAEVRGARLMSAGLPHPQWNSADVHDADVDRAAMARWYAERRVPWGARVPDGIDWPVGRFAFTKPNMGVTPDGFLPSDRPAGPGVRIEVVTGDDPAAARALVAVDAEGFGEAEVGQPAWVTGAIGRPGWRHYLASMAGEPVGATVAVLTDGWAGPAVSIFGVTVLAPHRRRGLASLLVSRAVADGFDRGARLAALNPSGDSRPVYESLGFTEVAPCHVFVDLA